MMKIPVYICSRDRLRCLRQLIDWLTTADGVAEIVIVDIDSTYPGLLEYYERTPHRVVRLNANRGVQAVIEFAKSEGSPLYALSDPDVIPREDCPPWAMLAMMDMVGKGVSHETDPYGDGIVRSAGFGLELTDLPPHYVYRAEAVWFESRAWMRAVTPDRQWFAASIDSTFHVTSSEPPTGTLAVRGNYPYVARHQSWYLDLNNLPPDELWYTSRSIHGGFTRGQKPHEVFKGRDYSKWPDTDFLKDYERHLQVQMVQCCIDAQGRPTLDDPPDTGLTPWQYKRGYGGCGDAE